MIVLELNNKIEIEKAFNNLDKGLSSSISSQNNIVDFEKLICCFIVFNNKFTLARACIYKSNDICYENFKTIFFGNFDSVNDKKVYNILFEKIIDFINNNYPNHFLIGPINGSTWKNYRISSNSLNPFFLEPTNPEYYINIFKELKFNEIKKYFSVLDKNPRPLNESEIKHKKRFIDKGINFRNIRASEFDKELKKVYKLNNISFRDNFLFSEIPEASFKSQYYSIKEYINPNYIILAEKNNELIGFGFGIHDYLNNNNKRFIIKTVAINENSQNTGLGILISKMLIEIAYNYNYPEIICALMAVNSLSGNYALKTGEILNTYSLFGKIIQ